MRSKKDPISTENQIINNQYIILFLTTILTCSAEYLLYKFTPKIYTEPPCSPLICILNQPCFLAMNQLYKNS